MPDTSPGGISVTITHLATQRGDTTRMLEDAREGLLASPKSMPSKYFYDARGSRLFDDITRLPEYYLTRAETEILEASAEAIIGAARPAEVVELGSGYSVKTKLIVDAMRLAGSGERYVPIDISENALLEAAQHLAAYYPWLHIDGYVGDFLTDLPEVPRTGRRLVTFLGTTVGNFDGTRRAEVLASIALLLEPGDSLLLGFDLVKDEATLLAAYDDAAGVTAAFNRNMLHVMNRELRADFPVDDFEYVATWDAERACIDMGLRATRDMTVTIGALGETISLAAGELIRNEVSCKFTRARFVTDLEAAGLALAQWHTDRQDRYAVALATPAI